MCSKNNGELPTFTMPVTERGKARWRKVVDTAKRMFQERGYNDVSLAEIVREAGGSLTTVYRWFGGKEDLFLCVVFDRLSHTKETIEPFEFSGPTARDDIKTLVEKLVANVPFKLVRRVFLETSILKDYQGKILELIERNTNVPIAGLFARIRRERDVDFVVSDEELALLFVRFLRGLFLELALDEAQSSSRLENGKRILVAVLTSLIRSPKGARL